MKTILRSTIFSILLGAAGAFFAPALLGASAAVAAPAAGLPDFADLVDKVAPAVVNIKTTVRGSAQGPGNDLDEEAVMDMLRRFGLPVPPRPQAGPQRKNRNPQQQEEEIPRGIGSGFIISADGYVLTNAHVVDGADEVYVTLNDKREFKAKIIGADGPTDVALVKIQGTNLPRLAIGDSNAIRVGEWVIAIGSPLGLDNTVTAGIISAKTRDLGDYLTYIQSDVAVNQGNSGGPMINLRGEVIGINSMIISRSGGHMGISMATPIQEAMRVADQLRTTGKVTRGMLGVQLGEVTKDVAESLGLPRASGAQIERIVPGSPAAKSGLKVGDIVLKFNGAVVERANDLRRMVGAKPNAPSTITVWRNGASRDIPVAIGELDSERTAKGPEKKAPERSVNVLGLAVRDLTDAQKRSLGLDGGVVVEAVEGVAARAGLRPGDLILQIGNADVKDSRQFNSVVSKLDPKRATALLVQRGESSQYVLLRPTGP
jgi:serine protease Do